MTKTKTIIINATYIIVSPTGNHKRSPAIGIVNTIDIRNIYIAHAAYRTAIIINNMSDSPSKIT